MSDEIVVTLSPLIEMSTAVDEAAELVITLTAESRIESAVAEDDAAIVVTLTQETVIAG